MLLQQNQLNASPDKWSDIWNSSLFSVKRAYKQLKGHLVLHPVYNWLWKSSCQNKHKVFFWLLIKDRLSTRELLRRKNMALPDYNCILCTGSVEESLSHLFLDCPFAIQSWTWINIHIDQQLDPFQNLQRASKINFRCLFSWRSSLSCVGQFGRQEMTGSSVRLFPIFRRQRSTSGKNFIGFL